MQGIYYPITHAQKRIWYTEQMHPGTSISNLGGFVKLKSENEIDCRLLIDAIRHFIRVNESMRLRISPNDRGGEPRQYVSEYREFCIEWFDWSTTGDVDAVMKWGQAEACKPMALYDTDLFYFSVFKINSRECWFYVKVHHIISDGISMVLLTNQIIDLYLELAKGVGEPQINHFSYLERVQSELDYERSERFRKDKEYWNAQFMSVPEFTSLKGKESYHMHTGAARLSNVISESLQSDVQLFCKEYNIGPLSLFLSLLYIYIHRATGQDDVVVGTFMSNRMNAKEKQMLGMLVSTIPVRTRVDEQIDFLSFVRQRMKDQLAVIRHQKYPYNLLVNDLRDYHGSVNKLFGLSLEFQVMQWYQKENISYLTEPLFSGNEINDISIHVKERWDTGALVMDIDYRTELITVEEIENLFRCMMTLLEDGLAHPAKKLGELEICSEEQQQRLLGQSSRPAVSYPRDTTLHRLFEQQAAKIPEQTAVVYDEEQQFTYKELNERSNRLGRVLRTKWVGPDTPVAILMDRSARTPAVILGILKAGGAYVPIDPHVPEERIRFILQDSGVKVLITESHLQRYDLQVADTLVLDEALFNEGESGNLSEGAGPRNLAYIIHTSGTVGKPKGVMIEHQQVQHLIEGIRRQVYASYETSLRVALVAPFHFDASVQQIFASLLLGHTLFIVPRSSVSYGKALADYYRSRRIDVTDGTPAHLQMLLATGNVQGVGIRHMLIGGEALPHATVRDLFDLFQESGTVPAITNVYGPTECIRSGKRSCNCSNNKLKCHRIGLRLYMRKRR